MEILIKVFIFRSLTGKKQGGKSFLNSPFLFTGYCVILSFATPDMGRNIVGMHMEETCIFLRDEIGEKWYDLCDQKRWDKGRI